MLYFTTALNCTNEIWKQVTQVTDALLYLEIAKVYVEFVAQHFGERELNLVLADIVRHAAKERSHTLLQEYLAECCLGVLRHTADFVRIVSLEAFLPLVDLLQGASQVSVHKELLAHQGTHRRTHKRTHKRTHRRTYKRIHQRTHSIHAR